MGIALFGVLGVVVRVVGVVVGVVVTSIYVSALTLRVTDQNRVLCVLGESPCELVAASSKSGDLGIVKKA